LTRYALRRLDRKAEGSGSTGVHLIPMGIWPSLPVPRRECSDMARVVSQKRRVHFFVVFCHWGMVVLLVLNILTGMRLGWGFLDSPLGGPHGAWAAIRHAVVPQGTLLGLGLIRWHLLCAWLLLLTAAIYSAYLCCSGSSRR